MRILIVDDEPQITRVLRTSLQSAGYEIAVAKNGLEAFDEYRRVTPDLVITDLAMPEMDGIALTKAIRAMGDTPILVLSVRNGDAMKVAALDEGADDYVTKPFSMQELMARVRAQLRRVARQEPMAARVVAGDFTIDEEKHSVHRGEEAIHLTPKEFLLMMTFARNPGRVLTHKVLLRAVWGPAGDGQPEYLRVLIAQLRKKIETGKEPPYVRSEPWVGYRFEPGGEGE